MPLSRAWGRKEKRREKSKLEGERDRGGGRTGRVHPVASKGDTECTVSWTKIDKGENLLRGDADHHVLLEVKRAGVERPLLAKERHGARREEPGHRDSEGVRENLCTNFSEVSSATSMEEGTLQVLRDKLG